MYKPNQSVLDNQLIKLYSFVFLGVFSSPMIKTKISHRHHEKSHGKNQHLSVLRH